MPIHNINSTLTKLRTYSTNFWSSLKVKAFSTIGSLTTALGIMALAISLYCKCFWNKMGCACKHTRLTTLLYNDPHIELHPITNPTPETSDQLLPQLVHEILKASGVDISKFECYKRCKALCQASSQSTELSKAKKNSFKRIFLQIITSKSGHTNHALLTHSQKTKNNLEIVHLQFITSKSGHTNQELIIPNQSSHIQV